MRVIIPALLASTALMVPSTAFAATVSVSAEEEQAYRDAITREYEQSSSLVAQSERGSASYSISDDDGQSAKARDVADGTAGETDGASSIAASEEKTYISAIAGEQQALDDDFTWVTSDVLLALDRDERLELLGKMAAADERATGIPASLTLAQCLIESAWGESGLSAKHENYFGIKASSGGYNWPNSTWDGRVADMETGEYYGYYTDIVAGFRVYDNAWDSMKDHSAYLLGSTRGGETRYVGITKATGPEAAYIMVEGGYATSPTYAETLVNMMDKYNLYRFDQR